MQDSGETIALGPGGPHILPLGVGTWQWGDRWIWDYGRGYGEADFEAAFRAAVEDGLTLFDTAEIYGRGRSERLLGRFIRPSSAQVVVATKFMPFPWRLRPVDLRRALEASLTRLGLDRVDLYQVHWPLPPVPIETWMTALADAVEAGLVGAIGVSNYTARQTERAAAALERRGLPLATNQVEYSLLQRRIERNDVLETCRRLGVRLIAYSPLAKGLLGGKYSARHPPPGWRAWLHRQEKPARIDALVDLLREIGQAHGGKTPAQVALNWLICQDTIPIPGARNAQHARENSAALGWRLTDDDLAALDRASAPRRGVGST